MKQSATVAYALVIHLAILTFCRATGYRGDMAEAWSDASIVVLGQPSLVSGTPREVEQDRGLYAMDIEKAYKGATPGSQIEFLDEHFRSTASLYILNGVKYLVFILTAEDRAKHPHPTNEGLGVALSGLRVFKVDDRNMAEIEAGLATVRAFEALPPDERKAFLLQNLAVTNAYAHTLIVREILKAGVKEAIPYFQERLAQATNETDKLSLISYLRCLGAPGVKSVLLSWLVDDSFKHKVQTIEEMVRLNDASVAPAIRNYINDDDVLLAVEARSALLRLGDPEGKRLCLDMIQKDITPTARYNAIHYLNWGYSGGFTEEEKALISQLACDNDPNIARVAGFIKEKWETVSNQVPEDAARKLADPQH